MCAQYGYIFTYTVINLYLHNHLSFENKLYIRRDIEAKYLFGNDDLKFQGFLCEFRKNIYIFGTKYINNSKIIDIMASVYTVNMLKYTCHVNEL